MMDTSFVNINGYVPCCINAVVTSAGNGTPVAIGNVLGTCNPNAAQGTQANITWLGTVYAQDLNHARLLTMTVRVRPGKAASAWNTPPDQMFVIS